jgi:transposase
MLMLVIMTYSVDLRERVVSFVAGGGSKAEAARRFEVSRSVVYDWMKRDNLHPKPYERTKFRKLDKEALRRHVQSYPQMLSKERAVHFGVNPSSICEALKRLKITRKKHN